MLYLQKIFDKKILSKGINDHCHFTQKYRGPAHCICNLKDNVPKKILEVFHNGSKYGYHFIINELANEFEGSFECIGENSEIYNSFSVLIKKRDYKN